MRIYQYTDSDGDRLRVDTITDGRLMFTTEDSNSCRTQAILSDAEVELLHRELGNRLGKGDTPAPRPLTEERVREIARAQARDILAAYVRPPQ